MTDTKKKDIKTLSEEDSVSVEAEKAESVNSASALEDPSTPPSDNDSKLKLKYCEKKVADKLVERLVNEGIIY